MSVPAYWLAQQTRTMLDILIFVVGWAICWYYVASPVWGLRSTLMIYCLAGWFTTGSATAIATVAPKNLVLYLSAIR